MMQQVATSGSEIAALKGKAGKGADRDDTHGSSFDTLFQQAQSSNQKSMTPDASASGSATPTQHVSSNANTPDDKKAEPRASAKGDDVRANAETKITESSSTENAQYSEAQTTSTKTPAKDAETAAEDGVKTAPPVEPETDIPDDGNLVNLDAKEIKMSWDEWLASQEGEVDWLAYVDAVRQIGEGAIEGPGKNGKSGDGGEILPVIPSPVSDAEDAEQTSSDSVINIPADETLQPGIAVLTEALLKSVNESGEPKPDEGKQEILPILPIIEELTALLTRQGEGEAGSKSSGSELSEQIAVLTAQLTEVLKAAQQEQSGTQASASGKVVSELDIEGLFAGFESEASGETKNDGQSADVQLLMDLIQTEITGLAKEGADKGVITPVAPQTPVNATGDSEMVGEELTAMRRLMNDLAQMSEASQSKATQALADKVVALLPASASDMQHNSVKQAVIAGVQEIQSQLSQGHEPGIDLKAIIADAIKEANIPVTSQMMAHAEQQMSQLQQLLGAAQSAAHQTATAHVASTETMIQENTQVRSEATKVQQQADNLDKPVNITKAEGLQQLNEKIRWMMNARNSMAEIRLDPPELGSMQVRVNVSGDTASVNFVVQSQQAREALADATPRLREMLAEQGIELGESFVRQQSSGQGDSDGSGEGSFAGNGHQPGEPEDMQVIEQPVTRESMGGIDYYV